MSKKVLTDDHHREACRGHVLLRAGVDHSVLRHVYRLGKDAGRKIRHQRYVSCLGKGMPFGSEDGIVLADMHVVRVGVQRQFFLLRDTREVVGLGGTGFPCVFQIFLCFFVCISGEVSGDDIIRGTGDAKVQRNGGKHARGAALKKQDLIVVGNVHDRAQLFPASTDDVVVHLGTVAHFHDGHS